MDSVARNCPPDWKHLPNVAVILIFSYLTARDICSARATCKNWRLCSKTGRLWRNVKMTFYSPAHVKRVQFFRQYGKYLHNISIFYKKEVPETRDAVSLILNRMKIVASIKISSLSIMCAEDSNGLVPSDDKLVETLPKFLTTIIGQKRSAIKKLNVMGIQVYVNADFIKKISENFKNLEYLNIICAVNYSTLSPDDIVYLLLKCELLLELHLTHDCLSNQVLKTLVKSRRAPFQRLGISCNGQIDRYGLSPSSDAWTDLSNANRHLKVTLELGKTYPDDLGLHILKSEMPVDEVVFIWNPLIPSEHISSLIDAVLMSYGNRIEKFVMKFFKHSYISTQTLLEIAQTCTNIRTLYVPCQVDLQFLDTILQLCPLLRDTVDYRFSVRRK